MNLTELGLASLVAVSISPASAIGQSVEPSTNPATWVGNADYPKSALRAYEEGRVGFTLTIGPDGKPTDCRVDSTSGSAALDKATCLAAKTRAVFGRSVDENGGPGKRTFSTAVWWLLPLPYDFDAQRNFAGILVREAKKASFTAIVVEHVFSGPGKEAGILLGDVITAIDDRPISKFADFSQIMAEVPIGTKYSISIARDNRPLTLSLTSRLIPPERSPESSALKREMWKAF